MREVTTIRFERQDDGIVLLTFDSPTRAVDSTDPADWLSMQSALERLEREKAELRGVIVTLTDSGTFTGEDFDEVAGYSAEDGFEPFAAVEEFKSELRRLETIGLPVVAAINGDALGRGLEIALACHHRVALNGTQLQIGLPEVRLGLMPGAGGVVRSVRLLGISRALSKLLLDGRSHTPSEALELGIVNELADSREDSMAAAKAWVLENPDAAQPWDRAGFTIPGGDPSDPDLVQVIPTLPAQLRKKLKGAPYPAPDRILAAAVEGAQVDFENALLVERRYFVDVATGPIAQNMIRAHFEMKEAAGEVQGREEGLNLTALNEGDSFSSRLADAFVDEGMRMLAEGVSATSIDQASSQAGFSMTALQLAAEIDPERVNGVRRAAAASTGHQIGPAIPFEDLKERLLFIQTIEAVRCLEAGLVESTAEANAGSILAIGFPRWTGGVIRYANSYVGGPPGFAARCRDLADKYGARFDPPSALVEVSQDDTGHEGNPKSTVGEVS